MFDASRNAEHKHQPKKYMEKHKLDFSPTGMHPCIRAYKFKLYLYCHRVIEWFWVKICLKREPNIQNMRSFQGKSCILLFHNSQARSHFRWHEVKERVGEVLSPCSHRASRQAAEYRRYHDDDTQLFSVTLNDPVLPLSGSKSCSCRMIFSNPSPRLLFLQHRTQSCSRLQSLWPPSSPDSSLPAGIRHPHSHALFFATLSSVALEIISVTFTHLKIWKRCLLHTSASKGVHFWPDSELGSPLILCVTLQISYFTASALQ